MDYSVSCATTQVGTIYLAFQVDASADYLPQTPQEMAGMNGVVRTSPWKECSVRLDDRLLQRAYKNYFCKDETVTDSENPINTVGRLIIMTSGISVGTMTGQVTLSYVGRLFDPKTDLDGASMNGVATFAQPSIPTGVAIDWRVGIRTGRLPIGLSINTNDPTVSCKQHLARLEIVALFRALAGSTFTSATAGLVLDGTPTAPAQTYTMTSGTSTYIAEVYDIPAGRAEMVWTPAYVMAVGTFSELRLFGRCVSHHLVD